LFNLFLAAMNLSAGDVFVDAIVSENGVDSLRLVQRPSGVKLIDEPANVLGWS
jgi:hypothetical protein